MQGQLFTQEFLTPGVFDTPAFQALSDSRFGVFKAALKGIFSGFSAASNPNEAQTENDIINKVLLALGWGGDTLPQVKLSGKPAAQFVALIAKLYAVESHAQDNNLSAPERLRYRQQHSVAVLADIQTLLLAHLHSVVPGSALGKALHYLSAQWPKLSRYVLDASYPIDNNAAENSIRPFVIGRRKLAVRGHRGRGQRECESVLAAADGKVNGINSYRYLQALFVALPLAQTADDYEALLPWNIALATE